MSAKVPPISKNQVVSGRWKMIEKLGSGTYGCVFGAIDLKCPKGTMVAMKFESVRENKKSSLSNEAKVYRSLSGKSREAGSSSDGSAVEPERGDETADEMEEEDRNSSEEIHLLDEYKQEEKATAGETWEIFDEDGPEVQQKYRAKLPDGFPDYHLTFMTKDKKWKVMVVQILGASVKKWMCLRKVQGIFCLRDVATVAVQALESLEILHDSGLIHRDLKPQNMVWGLSKLRPNEKKIYIVDFGTTTPYLTESGEHRPHVKGNSHIVGSRRYSSIANHAGIYPCRRCDIESMLYVLIHMYDDTWLPWNNVESPKDASDSWIGVAESKSKFIRGLCEGLPEPFVRYEECVPA